MQPGSVSEVIGKLENAGAILRTSSQETDPGEGTSITPDAAAQPQKPVHIQNFDPSAMSGERSTMQMPEGFALSPTFGDKDNAFSFDGKGNMGGTGSMIHNYYLYEENGQLAMIPWDYNLAFGTFQGSSAESAVNDPIDTPLSVTGSGDRPMADWIFASETYTAPYHQYFSKFLESTDASHITLSDMGTMGMGGMDMGGGFGDRVGHGDRTQTENINGQTRPEGAMPQPFGNMTKPPDR